MRKVMWSVVVLGVALTGCDRSPPAPARETPKASAALPADLVSKEPLGAAQDVAAAKQAAAGTTVVVRGRIGGRADPFVAGRAAMLIADLSLPTCSDKGESCPTYWDYCCEAPAALAAKTATVQVVGADGQPLKASLADAGLKPGAEVEVRAKVQESAGPVLVLAAERIYVRPAK